MDPNKEGKEDSGVYGEGYPKYFPLTPEERQAMTDAHNGSGPSLSQIPAPISGGSTNLMGGAVTSSTPPGIPAVQPVAQPRQATNTKVPVLGEIRNGYKFKGGDPANQGNWESGTSDTMPLPAPVNNAPTNIAQDPRRAALMEKAPSFDESDIARFAGRKIQEGALKTGYLANIVGEKAAQDVAKLIAYPGLKAVSAEQWIEKMGRTAYTRAIVALENKMREEWVEQQLAKQS